MNPILQALQTGYKATDILKYLERIDPDLASKISLALNAGHTTEEVLKYIYKGGKQISKMLPNSPKGDEGNLFEKSVYNVNPGVINAGKAAMYAGGTALAAMGGNKLLDYLNDNQPKQMPGIESGSTPSNSLEFPLPQSPTPQGPNPIQQGMQQQAIQRAIPGAGIPQSTQEVALQSTQQPQAGIPTPAPIAPQINALELVQKANLLPHIQALQKNIQDPKQITGVLYTQFPKEMQQLQKEAGKPMEEVIAEAMQAIPQQQQGMPESHAVTQKQPPFVQPQAQAEQVQQFITKPEKPIEPIKIEKGTKVVTPDDEVGEIDKISGKTVQIDTENGKKGGKLDETEAITPEVNDVLENYKRLIKSIPEEYKSGPLNFIGYDPDRKKLSLRYNTGDQYVYENIPEDEANAIAEALHLAKTTGANFYGTWSPGDPSRGAGADKLVRKLQEKYGGKGNEYSAKFKTLYDFLALPKQLLAEEKQREKDKERAEKEKIKIEEKTKKDEERERKKRAKKKKD